MGDAAAITQLARQSLALLNTSNTSPAQIKQSELQLERLKISLQPNLSSCIQVVELLLSPLLSSSLQNRISIADVHFGFHLLDELILRAPTAWSAFPDSIRASVRQIAVTLFEQLSTVDSTGQRFNRFPALAVEKTIALLSAISIREWPQRWPDFLDMLLSDTRRAETACHVLRVMSEDVHDFPDLIESARRQELIHAMALTQPKTLQFITTTANVFHQQGNYDALNSTLKTLQAFLAWASLHSIFSIGIPQACFALLKDSETREGALSALNTLVKRQFVQPRNAHDQIQADDEGKVEFDTEFTFRDTVFGAVQHYVLSSRLKLHIAMSNLPPSGALPTFPVSEMQLPLEIDEDEHQFHIQFFRMLCELGSTNFFPTFLVSKRKGVLKLPPVVQQSGAAFIELMLCAVAGPSTSIRMEVLPYFMSVIGAITKHQQTKEAELSELARFLTVGFINAASLSLIRFPKEIDALKAKFDEMDFFEDERLQKDMFKSFTAQIINSLGAVARICPEAAVMPSLGRFAHLLSTKPQQFNSAANVSNETRSAIQFPRALGLIVPDGTQHGWRFGQYDGMHLSAWVDAVNGSIIGSEAFINGAVLSKMNLDRESMLKLMRRCFELTFGISDEFLFPSKAHALRIFWPIYQDPKLLERCFSTLVDQSLRCSDDSRFKACLALSTLCRRLGNSGLKNLGKYRDSMCMYCANALASPQLELVNKTFLLEASISTIQVLDDLNEQSTYIEKLLNPVLEIFSSDAVKTIIQSPVSLYSFIESSSSIELSRLCEALHLLEVAGHQVVRPYSKSSSTIPIPGLLSRSVAPRGVDIGSVLVKTLHGLYNSTKFPLSDASNARQSTLYPTSRELTVLLNLEGSFGYWKRENAFDVSKGGDDENKGSVAEQRSNDLLKQYGIQPPDSQHSLKRETLKNIRRSSYEILRTAVLSGVSNSPNHIRSLLEAVAADCYYIEPIHLVDVTTKILKPLFSFPVVSADPGLVDYLEASSIPAMLRVIRDHVESAKLGEIVDGEAPLLDVARVAGRRSLARSAADMLYGMYPRIEKKDIDANYAPTFIHPGFHRDTLRQELIALWKSLCSPGPHVLDSRAVHVSSALVITAAGMAPANAFALFQPLLETNMDTAVHNVGVQNNLSITNAIGAIVAIIRKWPSESDASLRSALGAERQEVGNWVAKCVQNICEGERSPKKHKVFVRELVDKVAAHIGVSAAPKRKVKSLPEKLDTNNPARRKNRPRPELEDVVLGDQALDSLFGDGVPLFS